MITPRWEYPDIPRWEELFGPCEDATWIFSAHPLDDTWHIVSVNGEVSLADWATVKKLIAQTLKGVSNDEVGGGDVG